jgi:hypothetical protein
MLKEVQRTHGIGAKIVHNIQKQSTADKQPDQATTFVINVSRKKKKTHAERN